MKRIIVLSFLIFGFSLQAMQPDIFDAVRTDNLEVVKNLIDQGADVNQADKDGWTTLHWAALLDHLPIAQFLLARGASVNQADNAGRTALHRAACHGNPAIVELLLDNGACVDQKDKNGCTALHEAAKNGHLPIVQLLFDHGASITKIDSSGRPALEWAAYNRNLPCCELLVNRLMRIPNDTQLTKIYTFLWCMDQIALPWVVCNHMKPFLMDVIEQENRKKPDGSVVLRQIDRFGNADMKEALIAKFWPAKEENAL